MDEITRLEIEIEQGVRRLRRIGATGFASASDRREARRLEQAIQRKQETLRRLQGWLSPKRPSS